MAANRRLTAPLESPAELYQNHATNQALAAAAWAYVKPMLDRSRRNRRTIDERARRRYNQWALISDEKFYHGRANAYLPAVRRGVERLVTQWVGGTVPTDRWWDVEAMAPEFQPNIDGIKTCITIQLARRIRLKRKMRPWYRQLAIYGTSPIKYWWRYDERIEAKMVPLPDGRVRLMRHRVPTYDDPDVKVVDFFSFHVYPMTVPDVCDAKLVAEDILVDYEERKADPANYANLAAAKKSAGSGATGNEALVKRQERLRRLGITEDELNDADFLWETECYFDYDLRDGLGRAPCVMTVAWESVVTRLQRNAYLEPPYLVGKDAEVPEEWFAHARTEATDRLQIILNDAMNQDLDASTFANTPLVVIDPNYAEDYQSIAIYPGAKIGAPPEAVKFDRPPDAAYGQKEKIAYLQNTILENLGAPSGTSPSPAATGQPRGARTFGGMQMLQTLASSEGQEVVALQEELVWEPLLARIAWLNANFMRDDRVLRTAGRKGAAITVNRDTFKGDYAYDWLGATTTQSQMMLSSAMLVGANVFPRLPMPPGTQLNGAYLLKTWWEIQGLKGVDQIIIEPPAPIPAKVEDELFSVGRDVAVSPGDNDAEHIVDHDAFLRTLGPDDPRAAAVVRHLMTHHQQQLTKQQAQLMAQMGIQPPGPPPPPPLVRVDLKGQMDPAQTARFAGGNGGAPQPAGARAGIKPSLTPATGMGPARAMAGAPAGMGM